MKMRFKKTISLMLVICFIFSYMPQVFAFVKATAPEPTMTPLQDLRKNQAQEEEKEEEVYEELTPEEQEVLDEINNNPIIVPTTQESTGSIGDIQSTDTVSPLIKDEELETMATTSTSTVTDEGFRVEPVASVYNVLNNNNDYVSQATGALTYEKTLLSLPGVNGLDLNISVRYNSDDAVITKNEFEKQTEDDIRKINFNNFAIGWSFGFPSIIKSEVKTPYDGWDKETHLSFPDGSSYKIKNDIETLTEDLTLALEYYKLTDMTLKRKADTKNYELTYSNGTVYTFDGEYGNIKQIKDRFGNEISFKYKELDYFRGSFVDYIFNPSYYKAKINALYEIVDSAGRIVNIEYDIKNTSNGKEVKSIKIKANDVIYSTLILQRISTHEGSTEVLKSIIDAEGFETNYDYEEKLTHKYDVVDSGEAMENEYKVNGSVLTLAKVNLPTGGWIKYDYTKARREYSYYRPAIIKTYWYEIYKISKVSDSSGFERTYEYQNDRSGHPYSRLDVEPAMPKGYFYLRETTGYVEDSAFTYSCIMRENGKITVSVFDYKHNKTKELTLQNIKKKLKKNQKKNQ